MTLASRAEFARIIGKSKPYVTQLGNDGRLVMEGKLVDVEASQARIEATARPEWEGVRQRHAQGRENAAKTPPAASDDAGQGEASPKGADATAEAFRRFRAIKEHYQARHARMRVARKQGKLAVMAEVRRAGEHGGAGVRGMLENLADQLAPRCAPVRDAGRAGDILSKLLDGVLAQHDAWLAKTAASLRKVGAGETAGMISENGE